MSAPEHARLRPAECEEIELPGARVTLIRRLFGACEADRLLAACRSEVTWRQEHVRLFGRVIPSPRLTAWYGDEGAVYTYSGLTLTPRPWIEPLQQVRERLVEAMGVTFDGVLANLYRDGRDSMGWHSDDERELGPEPVIASVSFGETRRFAIQHRQGREHGAAAIDLEHGSLLVMGGATQRLYRHQVAKTRRSCGPRINLTFRRLTGRGATRAG